VSSEDRFAEALRIAFDAVKAAQEQTQSDFTLCTTNPYRS
jgi:hypothetical protein